MIVTFTQQESDEESDDDVDGAELVEAMEEFMLFEEVVVCKGKKKEEEEEVVVCKGKKKDDSPCTISSNMPYDSAVTLKKYGYCVYHLNQKPKDEEEETLEGQPPLVEGRPPLVVTDVKTEQGVA